MIRFEGETSATGDSGGPIYFGITAYGIHKGKMLVNGEFQDMFSSVKWLDDAFGYQLDVATD